MKLTQWQNSLCTGGTLHDFRQVDDGEVGVIERCKKCKFQKFFKFLEPNHHYLSYHLRQALQKGEPRFYKEYNKS